VRIDLPDLNTIPKENITVEFGVRSLDIKIVNYKGKNLRLRVPKTHNTYDSKNSKFVVDDKKMVVSIKKSNEQDNWFTLHKQNLIGESIDDK
jgi:hypothetical protein